MNTMEYEVPARKELEPGEQLLWAGQPRRGVSFGAKEVPRFIFSLFWCGFAIFWETSVVLSARQRQPIHGFFVLWGIPFVVIGLYMVIGRFFVEAWQRARTYYAVTTRRVIVIRVGQSRHVRSKLLSSIGELVLDDRLDGSGAISFGPQTSPGGGRMFNQEFAGFERLDAAREVYRVIRDAQSRLEVDAGPRR
jgi:hypothetical protein